MKEKDNRIKSKVGGQALIEGVMMRGPEIAAMAVRTPSGEIDLEEWNLKKQSIWSKIPIIRGVVNFISSMVMGYSCLSKSAEKSGLEDESNEEPSKFDAWLERTFGDKIMNIVVIIGTVLGLLFSIVLFMMVPSFAVKGINLLVPLGGWGTAIEGVIKILIFIAYLALVAQMKDIKRVFEYHGAEHKTIFCLEAGEALTVENVRKQKRFHPRCGTSFLIIVLILSILVFSLPFVPWDNIFLRTLVKLALLPVIVGIGYEFIKLAGKYDNWFTKIISFPGIKLQHLTTKEPDDSQIEVAIAAIKPCIPEDEKQHLPVEMDEPIYETEQKTEIDAGQDDMTHHIIEEIEEEMLDEITY
ncbi:DUF1385 domain-containing protein [Paludicola sp. MB14-C6]|uniref:DUF1385 domain-containing protein n=1 Tax=Paludihabitans sp. MB14-C6 TaxID=3070656 RepID=UPI0027DE242D|nr:DUF1385 domain-containing protein [Paludicola sp. MB14-C6]WMJ22449.1 DUF1385 domain-containing protein [Paludicola sp. MB14-C6]